MLISAIARLLVVATTTLLTLSSFYIAIIEKFSIISVPARGEFFAYSWIYGLRWSAGEFPFQPHGQLLYPLFALLDRVFRITTGTPSQILLSWDLFAFAWTIALVLSTIALVYVSMTSRNLLEYVIVSIIFVVAVPISLSAASTLYSLAYHGVAIPLAFLSLPLWNVYARYINGVKSLPFLFCIVLAIYLAVCILAKPTFLAYATPFFATEVIRAVKQKRLAIFLRIIFSGLIAVVIYLFFLMFYYRSFSGIVGHFNNTLYFMTSQANWYDSAKGTNWLEWYINYVVKTAGPFAAVATGFIIACLFIPRLNKMVTFAGAIGLLFGFFFLYQRSQVHALPEFISLVAVILIVLIRHGGILNYTPAFARSLRAEMASAIALPVLCIAALAVFFPIPLKEAALKTAMVYNNKVVVPVALSDDKSIRSILISIYPNVLYGVTDAICRGSGNIFDNYHSPVIEAKFGNFTCLTKPGQSVDHVETYNRAVFRKEPSDADIQAAEGRIKNQFAQIGALLKECRSVGRFTDDAEIIQCVLGQVKTNS